jgi:hypothetical protein
MLDRRRFLTCAAGGLLAGVIRSTPAAAQADLPVVIGDRMWRVTNGITSVLAL